MKPKIPIRFWSWLLALLGFTVAGCTDPDKGQVMYGSPNATFSVKARVVDAQNTPLANVLVANAHVYRGYFSKEQADRLRYAKTDAQGAAAWQWGGEGRFDSVFLYVCDPAGRYVDTLCGYKVDTKEWDRSDKGEWYMGRINKEVEVVLRKK